MALNLGETLRDAVDGPALDEVVGEDPADVDLPALSARIRHRRRTRAATRSAVGVAAAGAVAMAGVHGLGGRGVETGTVVLSQQAAGLCGRDVTTLPADQAAGLAPATGALASHGLGSVGLADDSTNLGTFVGRTLTATLSSETNDAIASGHVVLTKGSTVVAVGSDSQVRGTVFAASIHASDDASTTSGNASISALASDLAPCPTPEGTPARVPSGTYTVQYLWPVTTGDAASGAVTAVAERRSAAGPWLVTLLDEPSAVTLPAGYPAAEVPVVSGTLLSATADGDSPSAWTVEVAVGGDDGVTRAAALLRGAGAEIFESVPFLQLAGQHPTPGRSAAPVPGEEPASPQEELASLQARRDAAAAGVAQGQQAYDALVAANASPDSLAWAARELQAAKDGLDLLDQQLDEKRAEIAGLSAKDDQQAMIAEQQRQSETYRIVGQDALTADTRSWSVQVTQSSEEGGTVVTYSLTHR